MPFRPGGRVRLALSLAAGIGPAAWTILGILEFAVFVAIIISLVRMEFMPNRAKPWLLSALGLAVFTFSILAIGQNVTGENSGVAELYIYAGATGVLFFLVLPLPHLNLAVMRGCLAASSNYMDLNSGPFEVEGAIP